MASVYRAYQTNLEREVAIKVMAEQFASDPTFTKRFQREASAIARLNHPNILKIYDQGEEDGLLFIVMELIEGRTLKEELSGRRLSLARVGEILSQVASALDYANSQGIIHRDVKPTNVLMDRTGRAVLSDFGIAKMAQANTQLTSTGVGVGTPDYMSPEQAMGEPLDGRSDEYSLGVMVYEMLTGRVPFMGDTPIAIVMGHISKPLPSINQFNPEVPPSVEKVLVKALAKKAEERYESSGAFARAFVEALNDHASVVDTLQTQVLETPAVGFSIPDRPSPITNYNPEAERLYQQARQQEQQNNYYGAYDTFLQLDNRFPGYRDVSSVLLAYERMGYGRNQGPLPSMGNLSWQATPPPPPPGFPHTPPPGIPQAFTPVPQAMVAPPRNRNRNRMIGGVGLVVLILLIVVALQVSFSEAGNKVKELAPTIQAAVSAGPGFGGPPPGGQGQGDNRQPAPLKEAQVFTASYNENGVVIRNFFVRQGEPGVIIYGLAENTTGGRVSFGGKINPLDGNGNEIDNGLDVQAPHIIEPNSSVPFMVITGNPKAKDTKRIKWLLNPKPIPANETPVDFYPTGQFKKSDDTRIVPASGPVPGENIAGKVTNIGQAPAFNMQVFIAFYDRDQKLLFVYNAPLKNRVLAKNETAPFEVELRGLIKDLSGNQGQPRFEIWFEGTPKQ